MPPLTPPYPTATIYVPWDELDAGLTDLGNVAFTDADETFEQDLTVGGTVTTGLLDVNGDLYCGEDIGAVGSIAAGTTISAGTTVSAPAGFYEHGRGTALGEWEDVAYSAGSFTASAGSWTVILANVVTYAYTLVGHTLTLCFEIHNTNVTAAPATLFLSLGGFTAARQTRAMIHTINAGVPGVGVAGTAVGSGVVTLLTGVAAAAWTTTAGNDTFVMGQITVEVQP